MNKIYFYYLVYDTMPFCISMRYTYQFYFEEVVYCHISNIDLHCSAGNREKVT